MIIISHRGYWQNVAEQNRPQAFIRSFINGFGIETDIRDYNSELVISHDIPTKKNITVRALFDIYTKYDTSLPLALNIKSDGLQDQLLSLIKEYNIDNYFLFDMSVPDGIQYIKYNMKVFTRQSEYELSPTYYENAKGIWLDEFHDHWITEEILQKHINQKKIICIVSPELHHRNYQKEWEDYKVIESKLDYNKIIICTDKPEELRDFLNDQN
ncbi:hypothetical protein OAM25_02550 [Gammaproteobacteria bacterium]|nr:hypothetical protein [Gammaproteobacteria bacterium]